MPCSRHPCDADIITGDGYSVPVSYTHLDVYKRQALPKLSRQRLASVLNDCLELYSSETLLLIRNEKISAAHSGDSMDLSLIHISGGYREAIVVIRGLQVCSLTYPHAEEVKMPETENDETGAEENEDDTPQKVDPPENYEYLAFEWVDAHVMELNERCNESIAPVSYTHLDGYQRQI